MPQSQSGGPILALLTYPTRSPVSLRDKKHHSLSGDIVPVQVGSNETSLLHVHSSIFTRSSEVLKHAMKLE
jgi:hypothetical protein